MLRWPRGQPHGRWKIRALAKEPGELRFELPAHPSHSVRDQPCDLATLPPSLLILYLKHECLEYVSSEVLSSLKNDK